MTIPTARDVMSEKVHSVGPGLSLIDLERDLAAQRISGAPVIESGRVVGIVSRSDIDREIARQSTATAAAGAWYWEPEAPEASDERFADPTAVALQSLRQLKVRDIMTTEVISVEPGVSISAVARVMVARRIHRVLVLEDGELRGIVSSLDLVEVLAAG